jgi:hypothetical protein
MSKTACVDWTNLESAAKEMAGNWRTYESFCWHRAYDLNDADNWALVYTSNRDSGLLAQSNEKAINEMLDKYSEGDDPDLVFERHSHWACGHLDGLSVRAYGADGSITDAFREVCKIQAALEEYPLLDESDYSERELNATLENYSNEIGSRRSELPEDWPEQVYRHFSDTNQYRYVESRDDSGGWAPREKLVEALIEMGLLESEEE